MRLITRLAVFLIVAVMLADAPTLFGQRQGGPNTAGRQGGPDAGGRGRPGGGGPQDGQGRGRGRGQEPRTGTASIRGRVVSAVNGTPIRRASIQASYTGDQPGREPGRSAMTDDSGTFELRDLPAGRWTVRASKTGFIEQQFGQRSAFATTDPITVGDGQRVVADFRLSRGGAISGHVSDEFGDPVAGANVNVLRYQVTAQGMRTSRIGTSVPSDDTGAYRVYGLPPGQYYVSVTDPSAARLVVSLNDFSASADLITSVVSTARVDLGAQYEATLAQVRDTVAARPASTSYAPTYYPGTANMAEAQRLTLALGEEQSGINLAIVPVRAARISGRVTGSSGSPLQATINLVGQMGQNFSVSGGRGSAGDGAFTIANVPPGNYTLNVLGPSIGAAPPEVASLPMVVNGADIPDVNVTTGAGASVRGTVVTDNGLKLPAAQVRVTAVPSRGGNAAWTPRAEMSASGTFELEGLLGVYTLRFESLPAGWTIKSITANGVDISDAAVEFRAGDRVSMRVELTDRVTQVTGSVRSDRPLTGATVVIFADEPAKWTSNSRFVKTARLTDAGQFTVNGLPPHSRYLAVAIDFIEPGEPQNPEFLQRAKTAASSAFSLSAGDQRTLDLPLVIR